MRTRENFSLYCPIARSGTILIALMDKIYHFLIRTSDHFHLAVTGPTISMNLAEGERLSAENGLSKLIN
jgi:hypothetical protein